MKERKIRPGHKIVQVLLGAGRVDEHYEDGKYAGVPVEMRPCKPVPVQTIAQMFIDDPKLGPNQLYKLSGYVGDIRKYDEGTVRVTKNGREVETYQLMDPWKFNENGQNIDITATLLTPKKKTEPENVKETTATEEVVEEEQNTGESENSIVVGHHDEPMVIESAPQVETPPIDEAVAA